ncbi:hypothetical protein ACWDTP_07070 [Mycobacterium sp. NPDC003449]
MAPQTLIIAGALIVIAGAFVAAFVDNPRHQRWSYWCGWLAGTAVIACAFVDQGWRMTASAAGIGLVGAVTIAYFRTPYIKIGGRVFAFTLVHSDTTQHGGGSPTRHNPDAYGNFLTAGKYWWTTAVLSIGVGVLQLLEGRTELTLGLAVVISVLLAVTGHLDVRDRFPVARRQFVALGVVAVSSIPIFLSPILAYAVTYYWLAPGSSTRRDEIERDDTLN